MSYATADMRLMQGVPGQALYHYRTADLKATVAGAGYFNNAVTETNLATGDVISVVYGFGGTMGTTSYVAAVADGVVSLTETDLA
jgi:hypothetical protein